MSDDGRNPKPLEFPIQKFLPIARCAVLFEMHSVEIMGHEGLLKKDYANS